MKLYHSLIVFYIFVQGYDANQQCDLCVNRFNWTACDAAARSNVCSEDLVDATHNFLSQYNPTLSETLSSDTSVRQFRCFLLELEIDVSTVNVFIRACTYESLVFCEGWNANGARATNCAVCSDGMCERNATWDALLATTTTVDPPTTTAIDLSTTTTVLTTTTTTVDPSTTTVVIPSTTTTVLATTTTTVNPSSTTTIEPSTTTTTTTVDLTTTTAPLATTTTTQSSPLPTTSTTSTTVSTTETPCIVDWTTTAQMTPAPTDMSASAGTHTTVLGTSTILHSTVTESSSDTDITTVPNNAFNCTECDSAVSWEHCRNRSRTVQCTTADVNELHSSLHKFNPGLPVGNYSEFKCFRIQVNLSDPEHGGVVYGMGCTFASARFCARSEWRNATVMVCSGTGQLGGTAPAMIGLVMVILSSIVGKLNVKY
ncbi:mucin-2-like [Armigeres subalbatus]|uniref:mucin-2-like n=1 Tax=Armigeres subalbatus TaxID=124917 RepID=UPI002ED054E6